MRSETTETPRECPRCGKEVDPLRAGAVSIVGGQIIHFCSATCREVHLERKVETTEAVADAVVDNGDGQAPLLEASEKVTVVEPDGESRGGSWGRAVRADLAPFLPYMVEIFCLSAVVVTLLLLPSTFFEGLTIPALAGITVFAFLVLGVLRERTFGFWRILESAVVPIAAASLVALYMFDRGSIVSLISAICVLLADRGARLFELLGRVRSRVSDVVRGSSARLLASEWRDNSAVTAVIRRVSLTLEWARIPLAGAAGLLVWLSDTSVHAPAITTGALVLLAIYPRALRMVTGDAYLAVALDAAREGVTIRDAHAINRVGMARVVLFLGRRVLLKRDVRLVDWRVVEGNDEGRVLSALWSVQAELEGRFAEVISRFVQDRSGGGAQSVQAKIVQGLGVAGDTTYGRLICGTRKMLLESGVSTADEEAWATDVEKSGRRAFFVALGGRLAATFAIEEEPISGVQETVRGFSMLALEPAMVTTAEVDAANALGARLGIENVLFETGEEKLGSVLRRIGDAGDTTLLVGHGRGFEESLRSATAAVALGSEDPSQAGVAVGMRDLENVLRVVKAARSARRSIKINIGVATFSSMIGLGLATSWHYTPAVVVGGALGFASCAFSTFNGPYPLLGRVATQMTRLFGRLLKFFGMGRNPAS